MNKSTFADKSNRDARARELVGLGHRVKRYSVRNQLLHPMYVDDRPSGDTGFGNTVYRTHWPVLYMVDILD